jgi:hypothetical protein
MVSGQLINVEETGRAERKNVKVDCNVRVSWTKRQDLNY